MALADTGYNGGVIVPERECDNLGHRDGFSKLRLADEERIDVELFQSAVSLKDREMVVKAVVVGNQFIVGREVLDHFRVCFDHGQRVEIEN